MHLKKIFVYSNESPLALRAPYIHKKAKKKDIRRAKKRHTESQKNIKGEPKRHTESPINIQHAKIDLKRAP